VQNIGRLRRVFTLLFLSGTLSVAAQINLPGQNTGTITGDMETIFQFYNPDSLINAAVPDSRTAMNSYTNLIYTNGPVAAGIRYESYLNRLEGYPDRFKGTGIGYRYFSFTNNLVSVTAGNFYDQFGMGSILRIWEQRQLGVDNSMDGLKVHVTPYRGVYIKGVYGKQRVDFNDRLINGDGLVRGVDGEVVINELTDSLAKIPVRITLGGSFVSKFERDNNPALIMPENVAATAARIGLIYKDFGFNGEYAFKFNDPSENNNYIYKPGQSLMMNMRYSKKGFGIVLDYKFSDNMSFRSNRQELLTNAMIGFLPALTRPHTYNLAATLYPYNVQFNEVAYQANVSYMFKKGTPLGGKYGTTILANFAIALAIDTTNLNDLSLTDPNARRLGYKTNMFGHGDELYYQDFNIEIRKKLSKNWKMNLMYLYIIYNNDINQGAYNNDGQAPKHNIYAHIGVADLSWKIDKKSNLRMEMQTLITEHHQGNWVTGLLEYTYSPHWFVAVLDQWNFGNPQQAYRIHYLLGSVGYTKGSTRISMSYGKQRAGLFCVGGVCRPVPASNGFTLTLNSTF
jgi:hypothetical protein